MSAFTVTSPGFTVTRVLPSCVRTTTPSGPYSVSMFGSTAAQPILATGTNINAVSDGGRDISAIPAPNPDTPRIETLIGMVTPLSPTCIGRRMYSHVCTGMVISGSVAAEGKISNWTVTIEPFTATTWQGSAIPVRFSLLSMALAWKFARDCISAFFCALLMIVFQ
ncbi:hypothetical protein D3C79_820930 [compost metagenome]